MSELGNENQVALLRQSMLYTKDDYDTHGAAISDGNMFKKSILTPEQIHNKVRQWARTGEGHHQV